MPVRVFCSYSHLDRALKRQLVEHLFPLVDAKNAVVFWSDDELTAGTEFDPAIRRELEQANLILLLLSSSYYSSEYCRNVEMRTAMERHDTGQATVVTILLRAMKWDVLQISKYTIIPRNRTAVTSWVNIDEAFAEITDEIGRVIDQVEEHLRLSSVTSDNAIRMQNLPASGVVPALKTYEETDIFYCVPEVDGPVAIRCTGITELLPDIVLHFHGDPGQRRISDAWLYTITNVTSRLHPGSVSEATLSLATGHGITNLSSLRHGIRAVQGAANALGFLHIPLHELSKLPQAERNLRIANLRVNASQLGFSNDKPTEIVAFLRLSDTPVNPAQFTLSVLSETFQVHVSAAQVGEDLRLNQSHSLNVGLLGDSRTAERITATVTLKGRLAGYEPSGERTRFLLHFCNIPEGVGIFTTTEQIAAVPTQLSATQTLSDTSGYGALARPSIDGHVSVGDQTLELSRISLQRGDGYGAWELDGGQDEEIQEVTIGIVLAYLSDVSQNLPRPGKALVRGTLAPHSFVNTASPEAPVPRFSDQSVFQELFSTVRSEIT